jgi:hypothetical protein
MIAGFVIGSLFAMSTVGAVVVWRRRKLRCIGLDWFGEVEDRNSNELPLLRLDNTSASVELVARSVMKSYEFSPGEK